MSASPKIKLTHILETLEQAEKERDSALKESARTSSHLKQVKAQLRKEKSRRHKLEEKLEDAKLEIKVFQKAEAKSE